MNHHFFMSFGADEICVIQHLPTRFKFYPQKFGEHHFLLETDLKLMAFMRPVKVREVSFKSRECISGCYCVLEEFEMDIQTPTYSDQTMEEVLRLSIQRRQSELDCVEASK